MVARVDRDREEGKEGMRRSEEARGGWRGGMVVEEKKGTCRYFLWMLLHDGYKVRNHWDKTDGLEHQGICPVCETGETMKHILTECDAPRQALVWNLVSNLWRKKTGEDLRPTTGEIMACGAIQRSSKGETRFYRILVSEAAHLIWCLRNERVIRVKDGTSERLAPAARPKIRIAGKG